MSVWTAPITWAAGAATSASMNAEVRDHLNWLKGFADIITGGTDSDTGAATILGIVRPAAANSALQASVSGDAQYRCIIQADGKILWGTGAATQDVNLYRSAAGMLKTDYSISAVGLVVGKVETWTKAGTPSDADFTGLSFGDGLIVVDTSANKLWARTGGAWKSVAIA